MADLLTLLEAKVALKLPLDVHDHDLTLERWIKAVSSRMYRFLKLDPADYETSAGTLDTAMIPPEAVMGAELLLAIYYRAPDEDPGFEVTHGEMPWQVQNICGELRDPTLA